MSQRFLSSSSKSVSLEEEPPNSLPQIIINNPREKILPDKILAAAIQISPREDGNPDAPLVTYPPKRPSEPFPAYPLAITWSPDYLRLELNEEPIIARLWVWNLCTRAIYMYCCGLWDDTARLGATWRCYPRTRFWLAPGLKAEIFIRATPRIATTPPVPSAFTAMQIATQHLRDSVTAYFMIPIKVIFLKYIPPINCEIE